MPQIRKRKIKGRSTEQFSLVVCCVFVAFSLSCGIPQDHPITTWSAVVPSPDGNWTATALSKVGGGPGGIYDQTEVYLTWKTSGPPTPIKILAFDQQNPTMTLKMKWLDSKQLLVSYKKASLEFQVIRCAGIDIYVERLE